MKKFLTLLAFVGIMGAVNAQSTTTDAPKKEDAAKVEKTHSCAGHDGAKADGKACCAGKAGAKAEASADGKTPACCAGKGASAKSCDHAKADAGDGLGHKHAEGDGHDHPTMKAHECAAACKDGAHALACGEEGHMCSADCHAKK